jgi:hypothetical protein
MDDNSATEFETLAEMLLLGWVDRDGQHRYFKHGSREERAARYAIAHLLRDHDEARILKNWNFRHRLADLFDPSSVRALDVKFSFRREGGPGQFLRHRRIAKEMRAAVRVGQKSKANAPVRSAIEAAMDRYGIGERQAKAIWSRYGKPMMS